MANSSQSERTSKFRLQDLPAEIAVVVDTMKVGEVSRAFSMVNSKGKTVCAIAKLKSKVDGHKASMREDYQILKNVVIDKRKQDILHNWIVEKLKNTYVRVNDRYKNCDFKYKGWIK